MYRVRVGARQIVGDILVVEHGEKHWFCDHVKGWYFTC